MQLPAALVGRPRWQVALLPTAAAGGLGLLIQLVLRRMARAKRMAQECRLADAVLRVEERLPIAAQVSELAAAVAATSECVERLAKGEGRVADVFQRAGDDLLAAFSDTAAPEGSDTNTKNIANLFSAFHDLGEANTSCATQVLTTCESLRASREETDRKRVQHVAEADDLLRTLAQTELELAEPVGWLRRLSIGAKSDDLAARRSQFDGQWAMTDARLQRISKDLASLRQTGDEIVVSGISNIRQHTKAISEILVNLRPRQESVGPSRTNGRVATGAGMRVEGIMKTMSTAEGRQKLRDAEEAEAAAAQTAVVVEEQTEPLRSLPAESLGAGEWRIRGVYKHQALKAGLRVLDDQWSTNDLYSFPRGGLLDGGKTLMREKLLADLLSGKLRLQSIPVNDVAAAQRDLDLLSLRQLLRLRVLHIDFTPSGCGADSVSTIGSTHEAFLSKLDGRLFKLLGQTACGSLKPVPADLHKFGCEVVLLASATAAVPSPRWWCRWLLDGSRVFFDSAKFSCSTSFPETVAYQHGVLEVNDLSRADRHEPTGKLQWFDWRVSLVTNAEGLSPAPPADNAAAPVNGSGCGPRSSSASGAQASAAGPVGPSLSVDVLRGALGSLKRVSDVR